MFLSAFNYIIRQGVQSIGLSKPVQREVDQNLNHLQYISNRLSVTGAAAAPSIASLAGKFTPLFKGMGKILFLPVATLFLFASSVKGPSR